MTIIDEFYGKRKSLQKIKATISDGYRLLEINVKEGDEFTSIKISLTQILNGLKKEHRDSMCWIIERILREDYQEKICSKIIKELEDELEDIKEGIRKDFDLEKGVKKK